MEAELEDDEGLGEGSGGEGRGSAAWRETKSMGGGGARDARSCGRRRSLRFWKRVKRCPKAGGASERD